MLNNGAHVANDFLNPYRRSRVDFVITSTELRLRRICIDNRTERKKETNIHEPRVIDSALRSFASIEAAEKLFPGRLSYVYTYTKASDYVRVPVYLYVRVFIVEETLQRGHRRGIPTSETRRKCQ